MQEFYLLSSFIIQGCVFKSWCILKKEKGLKLNLKVSEKDFFIFLLFVFLFWLLVVKLKKSVKDSCLLFGKNDYKAIKYILTYFSNPQICHF